VRWLLLPLALSWRLLRALLSVWAWAEDAADDYDRDARWPRGGRRP
jgi:hypothetical protein